MMPPKMVPRALVSLGISSTRIAGWVGPAPLVSCKLASSPGCRGPRLRRPPMLHGSPCGACYPEPPPTVTHDAHDGLDPPAGRRGAAERRRRGPAGGRPAAGGAGRAV